MRDGQIQTNEKNKKCWIKIRKEKKDWKKCRWTENETYLAHVNNTNSNAKTIFYCQATLDLWEIFAKVAGSLQFNVDE